MRLFKHKIEIMDKKINMLQKREDDSTNKYEKDCFEAAKNLVNSQKHLDYCLSRMQNEIERCEKEITTNLKIKNNYAVRGMWVERMNAYKECADLINDMLKDTYDIQYSSVETENREDMDNEKEGD